MPSDPPSLFPTLPPELRNEIYALISTPNPSSQQPLTTGLPLALKTFTCKHTTVHLTPTHHGATNLLALRCSPILEAQEYSSWLLNNATSLSISIHFHGRINTFVPDHWAKKITLHLRKLAKMQPWLTKVARYDIRILWDPVDGVMKSKRGKRVAGQVPLGMAESVTQLMDHEVKRKCGDVRVALCLAHGFAVECAVRGVEFGFRAFLSEDEGRRMGFACLGREVRKAPVRVGRQVERAAAPLVEVKAPAEERPLIRVLDGVVSWEESVCGTFVVGVTTTTKDTSGSRHVYEYGEAELEFPVCHVLAECVAG